MLHKQQQPLRTCFLVVFLKIVLVGCVAFVGLCWVVLLMWWWLLCWGCYGRLVGYRPRSKLWWMFWGASGCGLLLVFSVLLVSAVCNLCFIGNLAYLCVSVSKPVQAVYIMFGYGNPC